MCKKFDKWCGDFERAEGTGALKDLAEKKLGISRITLWRYRTGARRPDKKMRKKIEKVTSGAVTPSAFKE